MKVPLPMTLQKTEDKTAVHNDIQLQKESFTKTTIEEMKGHRVSHKKFKTFV